jgi:bla regulator protein BlaR1
MNEWLSSAGPALANHLWQSTAFAAAVWAMTLALRKNQARARYGLWLAASIKFLLPFSLLVALGGLLPRPHRAVAAPAVYATVDEVAQPFSEPEYTPLATPAPTWQEQMAARLPIALASLWLCGLVVVIAVWSVRWHRVRNTHRRARHVHTGREFELLHHAQQSAGRRDSIPLRLSGESMEPGIFGIFRPSLIWPERLSERLDDQHIKAILIHELAHARRRDNLTAALHMFVEAAFWFHPLVWWMERRLVEERERACDEAVVAMGSMPGIYAESLLKAVRFCVESPLTCVAGITGADLNQRIRSIMTQRVRRVGTVGKVTLAAFGCAAIAGPLAFGIVHAIPIYGQLLHPSGPRPSFAVASVRPNQPGDIQGGSAQADSYVAKAKTLQEIIKYAYAIGYDRELSGGPEWVSTDRYTILAKPDDAEREALQKMSRDDRDEQMRLMVQSLLAERFGLKVSFVRKTLPIYALVVAKGGLKCTRDEDAKPAIPNMSQPRFRWSEGPAPPPPPPGWTPPTPEESRRLAQTRPFHMRTQGWPFWLVVTTLGHQAELGGRTVVDETGLHGSYDCQMYWSPDGSDGPGPSLFTAIQQQMGLKLEPKKAPVEILTIDAIEKPTSVDGDDAAKPAVSGPNIAATWQGTLHVGRDQRVVLKIARAEDRTLRATFYFNIDAAPDSFHPISTILNGSVLKFELPFGTYEGTVSADGNSIMGAWRQGSAPQPLNFTRASPETEWTIPQPAPMVPMAADANPTFEVATVKPSRPDERGPQFWMQGRHFSVVDASLSDVVNFAYGVQQRQVAGAPDWLTSEKYDISAVSDGEGEPNSRQWQTIVKKLMADRFQLRFHDEKRELPVYALAVAKGGPKLTRSQSDPSAPGGKGFGPPGNFGATNSTMADVADALGYVVVDRPVVDQTGLTGKFDLKLSWTPDGRTTESADAPPDFFTAIQQELGLKLEPTKALINVLVIDHVERPSAN